MSRDDLFNKLAAIVAAYGFNAVEYGFSVIRVEDKTNNVNFRTSADRNLTQEAYEARSVDCKLTFSAAVARCGGEPSTDDLRSAAHVILMAAALVDRLNAENTEYTEKW